MARKCTRWGRSNGRKVCRKYSGTKRKATKRKASKRRGRCQVIGRRRICRNSKGQITSNRKVRAKRRR